MRTYRIIATVRENIRDNQGIAVQKALNSLGFTNVESVRMGKTYIVTIEDDVDIDAVAKGLINEIMENYTIEELKKESPLAALNYIRDKIRRAFAIPCSLLKK